MFAPCVFGATEPTEVESIRKDVRDVDVADLVGFDGVLHLAAVCNDPVGNLNPQVTYDINQIASAQLAAKAKQAGVPRFVFFSSCSLYGKAAGLRGARRDGGLRAADGLRRVQGAGRAATSRRSPTTSFSPTYLRNATAYGVSPRLRLDVVVNNLVGWALTTGEIVLQSDGTPWRPLVHIEDISRAALAVLEAPRELIHDQAFNVGATDGELHDPRGRGDRLRGHRRAGDLRRRQRRARHALLPRRRLQARPRAPGGRAEWTVKRRRGGAPRAPTASGA